MMQNHTGRLTMDPEFQALRSMMQNKIFEVLTKMKSNPSHEWRLWLPNFAELLEEHIFYESSNKGNYISILHNGVETWISDMLIKMKQTQQQPLHQGQQQQQQQNHHHSMTYHNIASNSSTSCLMIPTGTGQVSLATESNNRGITSTHAAAGGHHPGSLLVQQHQSQGRPSQEMHQIQKNSQQVMVNNNNSNSNFPLIDGVQAPSTTGTNKGSLSLSQKEFLYLTQIKLILILQHARSCPAPVGCCPEKNCGRAQKFVKHIEKCYQKQCLVRHCLTARKSLLHFRDCKALNCPVCDPVHKLLFISRQKVVSLINGLKEGVTGKEVNHKTETELVLSSFLKPSAMPAPDSSQPCRSSMERGLNQFDSSGLLIEQRDVSPVLIDLTKEQHQPYPPPQQPLMKRQRVQTDVSPLPTEQYVHSRLEMDAKLGPDDSSQPDMKSSHNAVNPLHLPGIFSDRMDHKTDLIDLSIGWHQPHLSPKQPLLKKPRVNMDASAVPNKTKNRSSSSVQEVFPAVKSANIGLEMAVQIGAVESSLPVVKSSQNGVNLLQLSGVFSDKKRDGASLLMDLSKDQQQPQVQPEPLPKRPRINMDSAAVLNNTTDPSFHAVEEMFPCEKSADGLHANKEIDGHIGAVDTSQLGLKSSDKGLTQLDSSGVYPDQSDKEPNLVAVSQVLQLSHPSPQQSQPKMLIMNVDTHPEPVNAASPSLSALQDTLSAEHCVNSADARLGVSVKIDLVSQNLKIAPGVCDTLAVQMGYGDKCDVRAPTSAQADVNPTSLSEDVYQINQEVSADVENKERSDDNALKATQEWDKNLTAVKSENSKLKGVSMMECFTPEQVKEHIFSLSQNKGEAEENSCGLCKGNELLFEPRPIYCTPCGARIKRSATYYMHGAGEWRHAACAPCYNAAKETIHIESHMVPKARFEKRVNKENLAEAWVQCDKCEKWLHQICALFNKHINNSSQAEYTCPNCYISEVERGERIPLPKSALLAAKDLSCTRLSDFLEDRLFRRLKIERYERASSLQKQSEDVPGAEGLVIRVVSAANKRLEVKPRFYEIFQEENYPAEFPYKSKTILLFQNIDGVDVCLFAMYVHECGTDCAPPNQRRVYISYLDSVKYFTPDIKTKTGEALRTFVYHEILIGYLEYCKKRGFVSCYIWVCPPFKGDNYILYCHPKIQKTPKEDKLREWYLSMLKKGMRENIVVGLTNLHDHFFTQLGQSKAKVTAVRLPYFDGDYWPGAAEEIINKMRQEENDFKQQKGKTRKNIVIKRALKTASHTDISGHASKDSMLMKKLGEEMKKMKENFIMVHLQHSCNHCGCLMVSGMCWVCNSCQCFYLCDSCHDAEQLLEDRERHPTNSSDKHTFDPVKITGVPNDTMDPDGILENPFFHTRQAFLSLCQANHYQFDTLRRAKHSSMMVLYHLHNPTAPAFVATCSDCTIDIESGQGWRCNVCPDFELCNSCYEQGGRVNHPHQLTNHPSSTNKDAKHQTAQQKGVIQVMKLLNVLPHASKCQGHKCQVQGCRKLKSLFNHGIKCRQGISGGCPICKKMWNLLSRHARGCKESKCNVPRCKDLREQYKRSQQQAESRLSWAAAKGNDEAASCRSLVEPMTNKMSVDSNKCTYT